MHINNKLGCMFGLAIGDSLGLPIQFLQRDTYVPISDYRAGGSFNTVEGEYSDDTAMALCLTDSLINCQEHNAKDQLDRYLLWLNEGYMSTRTKAFDIGNTVYESLMHYEKTGITITPFNTENYSGNGSLMRLAPVVLFYANDIHNAVYYAGESSKTTHASPIAIDACRYLAYVLVKLFKGQSKNFLFNDEGIAEKRLFFYDNPLHKEINKISEGSFLQKVRDDIASSGYVVHTLEASMWSFFYSDSFQEGILKAVNLGDDADTVGAVTGQLLGAYYGIDKIPSSFIYRLLNNDFILRQTQRLIDNDLFSKNV